MKNEKHRNWVFTLFTYEDETIFRNFMDKFNTTFWEAGSEECPTTGKQHWQGWLRLKSPRTIASMNKAFKGCGHTEVMKGDYAANEKYCNKDGKGISNGQRPAGQGHRSDIEEALNCDSIRELFETQTPNFQTLRVLEKHLEYCETPKVRECSTHHFEKVDLKEFGTIMTNAYVVTGSRLSLQWDGYDGQTCLIIYGDDYCMLPWQITEGLPYRVRSGQTTRMIRVTDICIIHK